MKTKAHCSFILRITTYIELIFVSTLLSFPRLEQFYCTSEFDFQSGLFRRESALTRLWSLIRQGAARPIRT